MSEAYPVFWLRRDLRLEDNHGLYQILKDHDNVQLIFIFDKHILDKLDEKHDRRLVFIHRALKAINDKICGNNASIKCFYDFPENVFEKINASVVYTNKDYEPYARERDGKVESILKSRGIEFKTFKDQVIFEKDEIVKDDGKPYTVYTPYSKKWLKAFKESNYQNFPSEELLDKLKVNPTEELISLEEMGFVDDNEDFPPMEIDSKIIKQYADNRNFPAIRGTSRLSVHLRFGTQSIRQLTQIAEQQSASWLNELIWRNFYMMILWHFPQVENSSFRSKYDQIVWRNNEEEFKAWCDGQTGYPIVDAGMRELNATGFMHNRVRMITASFLTKHLLIDWRWGEAYFAKKLLDFELASNNGGWQWASGSGCDAAPYFRVFNPELQTKKFDPNLIYIKKWVPEFQELNYAKPIVEHKFARERALRVYKEALS